MYSLEDAMVVLGTLLCQDVQFILFSVCATCQFEKKKKT